MENIKRGLILLALMLFIPLTSAEIIFSQPNSIYNLGDDFDITMDLSSNIDSSGFFTAELLCSNGNIELFKSPNSLKQTETKNIQISTTLNSFILGDLKGDCRIEAKYNGEESTSQSFEITDHIDVVINLQGTSFNPGDKVTASGQAIKANDVPLDGFVEVSLSEIGLKYTNEVKQGKFQFNFTLPDDAPAGSYEIKAKAYEKDSPEKITNQGESTAIIKVKQIMKTLDISINSPSIIPGNDIVYTIIVYDQSGSPIEADIGVEVFDSKDNLFFKELARTGESTSIQLEQNATPGNWKIESKVFDLEKTTIFEVEELRKISSELNSQILKITNIGNVLYEGLVEISIGSVKELKEVKLEVGQSRSYKLIAPDGDYEIEISDGSTKEALGTTFLTGNAVSVSEVGSLFKGNIFLWVWIIIILILAVVALYLYRKLSSKLPLIKGKSTLKSITPTQQPASNQQQHTSVTNINHGTKEESVVISLLIKNLDELEKTNPEAIKVIDSALWNAKEAYAKVYSSGNYRLIILSPILTKDKDNTSRAIILSQTIERALNLYNKRSKSKIDFGISIHIGELIVESNNGKFRFVSVGNTLSLAKRISQIANSEILLSEQLHRRTVGKVKALKVPDKELWKLDKIIDRSQYQGYIKNFKQRQEHDSKHKAKS